MSKGRTIKELFLLFYLIFLEKRWLSYWTSILIHLDNLLQTTFNFLPFNFTFPHTQTYTHSLFTVFNLNLNSYKDGNLTSYRISIQRPLKMFFFITLFRNFYLWWFDFSKTFDKRKPLTNVFCLNWFLKWWVSCLTTVIKQPRTYTKLSWKSCNSKYSLTCLYLK